MKRFSALNLFALAALCAPIQADGNIVETAVGAGGFETLTAALGAAGLVDALQGEGPFTVFAPTDEAFAKLPHGTVRELLQPESRELLISILTYHVVPGNVAASAAANLRSAGTLQGQRLDVSFEEGRLSIDDAKVVVSDIECTNGVIHVIDSVLLPEEGSIVDVAQRAGSFGTLIAAAKAAGLAGELAGGGPYTVFAPNDAAFAELPQDALQALLRPENKDRLASILKYHVVAGRLFGEDALAAGSAKTLLGQEVEIGLANGRLTVGGARILTTDVEASNGVVHVIDTVLLPAQPEPQRPQGRKVVGFYLEHVSEALAEQLGVDRSRAQLVTRVVDGSNAERAGFRRFDVIVEIEGRPASSGVLDHAKRERDFGETIAFTVLRRGERVELQVPIGVEKH